VVLAPTCGDGFSSGAHRADHLARVQQERFAGACQADSLRRALEEREPAAPLEVAHGARNRRLAHADRARGGGKAAVLGHRDERAEQRGVHAHDSIITMGYRGYNLHTLAL